MSSFPKPLSLSPSPVHRSLETPLRQSAISGRRCPLLSALTRALVSAGGARRTLERPALPPASLFLPFPFAFSSCMQTTWSSGSNLSGCKRQHCQVNMLGLSESYGNSDTESIVIITEISSSGEAKQTTTYDEVEQNKVAPSDVISNPSAYFTFHTDTLASTSGSSEVDLPDLNSSITDDENNFNEDEPDNGDENEDHNNNEDQDDYNDDDEYEFYLEDDDKADFSSNLSAQFDDLNLPPGVEATVPWLEKPASACLRTSKRKKQAEDETEIKFKSFKKFDVIQGVSDHHYAKVDKSVKAKDWTKKIQHEWKILESDLPDSIFVRVYEDRMDLLRAVIIGPPGTPYHDGLFFFDFQFPSDYPQQPPAVYYHSGGLRINPNLYAGGKVCLSLLNTWYGTGCEKWNPSASTMLQVLVSIQALILNENPYFNEPGYETMASTSEGRQQSLAYSENAFLLSCKTMLYSLRRPPQHFSEFVDGYFRKKGHTILAACKAYMSGARVGSAVGGQAQNEKNSTFTSNLKVLFEDLLMEFTVKGADCDVFLAQKIIEAGAGVDAPSTLQIADKP